MGYEPFLIPVILILLYNLDIEKKYGGIAMLLLAILTLFMIYHVIDIGLQIHENNLRIEELIRKYNSL
jgi:hypothetical protein